jgi:hypothetical protein
MACKSAVAEDVITASGRDMLARPADELRARFAALKIVQFDDFVRADVLSRIVRHMLLMVRKYAVRIERPHLVTPGSMVDGRRFWRIDGGPFAESWHTDADRAAIREAFDASGLNAFAACLLAAAQPTFEAVVGRPLRYDRVFLLDYGEGDFIAPHGDTQTSGRILAQMPVTFNCRTAFRALRAGWMEPFYDDPGSLRLMGPGIWHDALPVPRLPGEGAPERVVVTVRLPYREE